MMLSPLREFGNEAEDRQSQTYDRFRNSSDVDFESRARIISRRLAAARMYLDDILSELNALIQQLRVSPALRELQKLDLYGSSKGQTWQRSPRSRSPSRSPERWGRDWRWNDVRRRIDEASTQLLPSVASNSWRAEQIPPSFLQPPSRASSSSLLLQRNVLSGSDYGFASRPNGMRSSDGRQEAPPSMNSADDSSPNRSNGSAEYRESMVQDGDGSPSPRRSTLKTGPARQSSRVAFSPQTEIRHLSSDQFEETLDPPQEAERASSSMEDPQESRKQSMVAASSSARKSSTDQLQEMPRRSSRESEAQPYSQIYAAGTEASEWSEAQDQFGTPNAMEPAATYYADGELEGSEQAGGPNTDLVQQSEADGSLAIVDNSGEIMSRKSVRQKSTGRRSKSDTRSASFQAKESSSEGLGFDESEMLRTDEQPAAPAPTADSSAAAAVYGGSRKTMYTAGNASIQQQLNPSYAPQGEENPSRPRSGSSSSVISPQRTSYSNYVAAESQGSPNADLINPSRRSRSEQPQYQSADGRKSRLSAQGGSNIPMAMDGRTDMEMDGENATYLPLPPAAAAASPQGRKSRYQDGERRRSQSQGGAPQLQASMDDAPDGRRSQFIDFQGEEPSIPTAAVPATTDGRSSRRISNDGRKSKFVMGGDDPQGVTDRMNGVAEEDVVYGEVVPQASPVAGRKSRIVERNEPSLPEYRGSSSNPSPGNVPRISESRRSRINGKQAYERNSLQAAADESDETTTAQGLAMRKSQVRDPAMPRSEGRTSRFMSSRDENPLAPFSFTEGRTQSVVGREGGGVMDAAKARETDGRKSRYVSKEEERQRMGMAEGRAIDARTEIPIPAAEEVSGDGTMQQQQQQQQWESRFPQEEGGGDAEYYDQEALMEWESRFISRYAETDEPWMEMEGSRSADGGQDSMGASSGYHGRGSRVRSRSSTSSSSILGIPSSDKQNAEQQERWEPATGTAPMARPSVGDSRTRNQNSISPPRTNSIGQSMGASVPEICIDVQATQAIRPGISIEWWQ